MAGAGSGHKSKKNPGNRNLKKAIRRVYMALLDYKTGTRMVPEIAYV